MKPLKETTVYVPVGLDKALEYEADAVLINSDIDTGETVYILPKSLYCFTKEDLEELLYSVYSEGAANQQKGFSTMKEEMEIKEQYINSFLK